MALVINVQISGGFSAQICVYTAVYFLCQKTAWLPGNLFSLALRNKNVLFRAGDLFSLQKSKYSENSDRRIVWDNWSEVGLCQQFDWQTRLGISCCWWITWRYQKRRMDRAAAQLPLWDEVVWIVTYTCVSVYRGAQFPPPCVKILYCFVKGKWLKRLASPDECGSELCKRAFLSFHPDSFLLCWQSPPVNCQYSLCQLIWTVQLCMVIFYCSPLKASEIAQPVGLANTIVNVFLSWLAAACVHLFNFSFISLYDIFLVLESGLHGLYL